MNRAILWGLLVAAAAVAVTTVAIPTLYIQPFKPQAADGLARAYAFRQAAPTVTAICLPVVVLSGIALLWLGTLRPRRALAGSPPRPDVANPRRLGPAPRRSVRHSLRYVPPVFRGMAIVVLVGLTGLVSWFCRQNHFEWMFAPLPEVRYVSAADASRFLTGDEMVMGIDVAGLSLAYPIRQMAYHHVVNDMLGTTPVVVTY